jgi:hypothetical protein
MTTKEISLNELPELELLILIEQILSKPGITITDQDQTDLYKINEVLKEREKTLERKR